MKMPDFALNSVYAKVKALYGKRLTQKNYTDLFKLNSINEIAEYLRTKTAYSEIFEGLSSTEELQRSRLETLLFNKMYNDMLAVIRFQKAAGSNLYEYFIMKYDIEQIIKVLSSLETKSDNYFFTFPVFYNEHSKLDLYALARAKNDLQLLECTEHTVYYSALRDALTKYRLTGSLTALQTDMGDFLDSQFISLTSGKKKIDTKSEIINLYKCINDINLVSTLYRIKRFDVNDSLPQLITDTALTCFSKKELEMMIKASTVQELDTCIRSTYMKQVADTPDIHRSLNEYLYEKLTLTVQRSSSADAVMFAYFHFTEFEIRNIIHIIEGKRYSLSEKEISDLLFGTKMPI